jgi:hypothetical protein
MATTERPTRHPVGESCPALCEECAEREAERRGIAAEVMFYEARARERAELAEWHRLFGDLEAVRQALTAVLPFLPGEQFWSSRKESCGWDEPFPQAEAAVRLWLFDATPSDRDAMETLARALYRSQIEILARYADFDRLTPEVRAQVMGITAEA